MSMVERSLHDWRKWIYHGECELKLADRLGSLENKLPGFFYCPGTGGMRND